VEQLRADLGQAPAAVVVEYKGMTVDSVFRLRKALRDKGAKLKVVKNTLLTIACEGTPNVRLKELAGGPIAVAYTAADPSAMAKEITAFAKKEEKLVIRGGVVSGQVVNGKGVEELALLPPFAELQAKLLGVLTAPMARFLGLLQAPAGRFLAVLKAKAEKG
jgi:large subunit ribosomal protein L10